MYMDRRVRMTMRLDRDFRISADDGVKSVVFTGIHGVPKRNNRRCRDVLAFCSTLVFGEPSIRIDRPLQLMCHLRKIGLHDQ
jgi:hypothetical protein